MYRDRFKRRTVWATAVAGVIMLPGTLVAQNEVTVQAVTDNIAMLVGRGGNIGLFMGEDGTFMIDDKFADMTSEVGDAIKAAGGETPKFLINTHWHRDHTGGNDKLGSDGAVIVAHDNVRERMAVDNFISAFDAKVPAASGMALPMVTFDSEVRFNINGETVNVIHIPNAHTDGDSLVHFPTANVLHTGDLFFNGFFPFIDVEHGGSLAGMIAAADTMLGMVDDETKIIPGHGPLATKADLQAYRDMLSASHEKLTTLKSSGKTLEEIGEMQPLSELDEQWGQAMFSAEKWIQIIYDSVAAN